MLNLAKVSQQIRRMAAERQLVSDDIQKRLEKALGQLALESGRLPAFMRKLQASKTSWLLAGIHESLEKTYALPPRPLAITVVATDGSQIAPSHHEVVPAFLLNISTVVLHYGTGERAELTSTPTLFYRDEDLYMDYGGQRVQVTGDMLGMRRTLMEFQELLRQATDGPGQWPSYLCSVRWQSDSLAARRQTTGLSAAEPGALSGLPGAGAPAADSCRWLYQPAAQSRCPQRVARWPLS